MWTCCMGQEMSVNCTHVWVWTHTYMYIWVCHFFLDMKQYLDIYLSMWTFSVCLYACVRTYLSVWHICQHMPMTYMHMCICDCVNTWKHVYVCKNVNVWECECVCCICLNTCLWMCTCEIVCSPSALMYMCDCVSFVCISTCLWVYVSVYTIRCMSGYCEHLGMSVSEYCEYIGS